MVEGTRLKEIDMKKTVCFDFDGVIHKYSRGWTTAIDIYDEPAEDISVVFDILIHNSIEIVVCSTRAETSEGQEAIWKWLRKYELAEYVSRVTNGKPPAVCYVDDRAINWKATDSMYDLVGRIDSFVGGLEL
jgi:hypothetical protein